MNDPNTYLRTVVHYLKSPYKEMCQTVLDDERFLTSPGGATRHHGYKGGLLQHTAEVCEYALQMSNGTNHDLLACAAIFHDRNKIFEYELLADGTIKKLDYRVLVGHVVGSLVFFLTQATRFGLDEEATYTLSHVLLAHHGRHEWRSPVEPQTIEAHILHVADMLSARNGRLGE